MWEEKDGVTQYPTGTDFLRTTTPKLRFLPTLNSKLQVTQVTGLKKVEGEIISGKSSFKTMFLLQMPYKKSSLGEGGQPRNHFSN